MIRIRILGFVTIIIALLIAFLSDSNSYDFLSGILAGLGVGWALSGRLLVLRKA